MRRTEAWTETWMRIARDIARRSKDPSTQVGAVLVAGDGKKFLSSAYNGPPGEVNDAKFDWSDRDTKHQLVFHAESNALWFAALSWGEDAIRHGCLFVTGKPCHRCVLECSRARVKHVVYDDRAVQPKMLDSAEWERSCYVALLGGVQLVRFSSLVGESSGEGQD